jgi:hypothetical protein
MDHGEQQLSLPREIERCGEREPGHDRNADQDQVVDRKRELADLEVAGKRIRLGKQLRLDAPDQLDRVFEHQEIRRR